MHQYQQEAIAAQRVAARRHEAEARRQRQAAKRIRRRPWFGRRRTRRATPGDLGDRGLVLPMLASSQVPMDQTSTDRRAA